ncbi:LOW QUALITY PROTEIN: hypothetical protein ColTof4_09590 [Colletotrichum tofieldiae]|nr:LOW QUALITY PROTEIN: hypothetical protein ColTof3_04940 [Colletotrichum tofieldiae]GKT77167.1 LOW QUALITY PROTEIN: hypothetical protein ColTof4_09590 [Colletotrichum tofieldiae]
MDRAVGWETMKGILGPCNGCGTADQHVAFSDSRCYTYESIHLSQKNLTMSQLEADHQRAMFEAWWQDSEQLRQALAREDAYISSLHAAMNESYGRRTRFQEEFNARWGNPAHIHAGLTGSTMSLAAAHVQAHAATQRWEAATQGWEATNMIRVAHEAASKALVIANRVVARAGVGAESEEEWSEVEWSEEDNNKENERPAHGHPTFTPPREKPACQASRTEQSQADAIANENPGVGSVERWLAGTLDTAPERNSPSREMGESAESPGSISSPQSNERPGDCAKLSPATLHRPRFLVRNGEESKAHQLNDKKQLNTERAYITPTLSVEQESLAKLRAVPTRRMPRSR